VKPVGEPYSGNRDLRFDERRWETGRWPLAPSYRAHLRLYHPDPCGEAEPRSAFRGTGDGLSQASHARPGPTPEVELHRGSSPPAGNFRTLKELIDWTTSAARGESRVGVNVRRQFIRLVGVAAIAWPLTAHAQQTERMRRIGVLMSLANDADGQIRMSAFRRALQQLGWTAAPNFADQTAAAR
jgi:hypothetical protein